MRFLKTSLAVVLMSAAVNYASTGRNNPTDIFAAAFKASLRAKFTAI